MQLFSLEKSLQLLPHSTDMFSTCTRCAIAQRPSAFPTAIRSVNRSSTCLAEQLADCNVQIPSQAAKSTIAFSMSSFAGQLYAWAWPVETADTPEWSLCLLLKAYGESVLPVGIELQVSDLGEVLAKEKLTCIFEPAYLYIQVQGLWPERFWATVTLPGGEAATMPAFYFEE